ncbi:MAG: hypothetical protein RBG13Loki_0843 [Promethearchaeota archaeon CR_4]|nr:MAG: hypothetical protein RBG13Loki_0843 [Candidatus Lokiarchaeota archaeon CR_4]
MPSQTRRARYFLDRVERDLVEHVEGKQLLAEVLGRDGDAEAGAWT